MGGLIQVGGRKRLRLVPRGCVEIFEIRIALYFDQDGRRQAQCVVSDPASPDLQRMDLVELRGALSVGTDMLIAAYEPTEDPDDADD